MVVLARPVSTETAENAGEVCVSAAVALLAMIEEIVSVFAPVLFWKTMRSVAPGMLPACREPVEPVIVAGATEAEDIRMPEPATVRMFAPRA